MIWISIRRLNEIKTNSRIVSSDDYMAGSFFSQIVHYFLAFYIVMMAIIWATNRSGDNMHLEIQNKRLKLKLDAFYDSQVFVGIVIALLRPLAQGSNDYIINDLKMAVDARKRP